MSTRATHARKKASPPPRPSDEASRLACHVARLMDDGKCEQVRVFNLVGLSPVTDLFVIGSGTSERQIASVLAEVSVLARGEGFGRGVSDGSGKGGWVVVDFFEVMVHLFTPELRAYYDLESLWGDAPEVDWRAVTKPGQFAKLRPARNVDLTHRAR